MKLVRTCRKCGCTEDNACEDGKGGTCYWVDADLCSECIVTVDEMKQYKEFGTHSIGDKSEFVNIYVNEKLKTASKKADIMRKITVQTSPLLAVLKKVKEVIDKKPVMALLENVLFKIRRQELQIIATDLIVTVDAKIEITNDGDIGYEYLLPFQFLLDVVMRINDSAFTIDFITTVRKKETHLSAVITTYSDVFEIKELEGTADWPAMPEFPHENSVGIADGFIEWLNLMCTTVSKDETRPALQKIYLDIANEGIAMVSTNGHIMVEKTFALTSMRSAQLLISTKIAKALKGFKETSISWSATHVAFISSNITLIGTLQDEKYPDYHNIFPYYLEQAALRVSLTELTGVMNKVALTKTIADIYLRREIGHIVVVSKDMIYNRDVTVRIGADYTGDCELISINPDNLAMLLAQIQYVNIALTITAPNRPILLTTESDPTYRAFLMPVVSEL